MSAIVLSAALVTAFAHVYATVRDNPAAHYANHPVVYREIAERPTRDEVTQDIVLRKVA